MILRDEDDKATILFHSVIYNSVAVTLPREYLNDFFYPKSPKKVDLNLVRQSLQGLLDNAEYLLHCVHIPD